MSKQTKIGARWRKANLARFQEEVWEFIKGRLEGQVDGSRAEGGALDHRGV